VAFKFNSLSPDLINGTGNFAAFDNASTPPTMVQGTFHFKPTGGEAVEVDKLKAAAKAVLLQAANEL
jgi:hypothetical protein